MSWSDINCCQYGAKCILGLWMVSDGVAVIQKKSSILSTHVQISLRSTCTTAMVALVEGLCSMIKIQDSVDVRGLAKFLLFKGEIRLFSNNIVIAMATKLHLASEFTL